MGKKKNEEVRKYFLQNKEENKQVCQIDNCGTCLSGDNLTNMYRHIKVKHDAIWTKIKITDSSKTIKKSEKLKSITVQTSETVLWDACIELVTVNGLPYSFINSSGFQKIINPMSVKLQPNKSFNIKNLKQKINETAADIKQQIKEDIKNKFISLKIDGVSRYQKSLLGINIQYIKNSKICVKTIGMKSLNEKHTAAYLKQVITKVLNEYNISLKQIYAVTSDNGRNMIKCTELLHNDLIDECDVETVPEIVDVDVDNSENISNESNDYVDGVLLEETVKLFAADVMVNCIRCAAHTVQLVVTDAIKILDVQKNIAKCRKIAVCLRKPTNYMKLETMGLRKPLLSVPTRWNSDFDMIERILELKPFCDEQNVTDKDLFISEDLATFMIDFVQTFRPLKNITINLQKTELCFTDFYKEWLCLKLHLNKLNNEISKKILEIVNTREKTLLESPVLLSALYLDPRFKFLLKPNQITMAQNHLKMLADNITAMEQQYCETSSSETNSATSLGIAPSTQNIENNVQIDDLTNFLNSQDSENENVNVPENHSAIINFNPDRLMDHTVDILLYWKVKSNVHPVLYKLAEIVLSVPATQCSVERSFSALASILTADRTRISNENLENILIVKLNKEFI